jgi:hypothetical protein
MNENSSNNQQNEINYVSSIYNTIVSSNEISVNFPVETKCSCFFNESEQFKTANDDDDNSRTMITFNVNMASTPKTSKVKSVLPTVVQNCDECKRKEAKKLRKLSKNEFEYKLSEGIEIRKEKQRSSKKKSQKMSLLLGEISFAAENAAFLRKALKKESRQKLHKVESERRRTKLHDLTTSTKKLSVSFKRSIKKSIKQENVVLSIKKSSSRKASLFGSEASSLKQTNQFNNYFHNDGLNKFYQLGQLQVWYV